jgi:hypothetical protein
LPEDNSLLRSAARWRRGRFLPVLSSQQYRRSRKSQSPDPTFARAMEAVNAKLKDAQPAHYGEMVRTVGPSINGKPAEVVCGSVNIGYGRNRLFVYFIADGATFLVEANPQPEDVAQIIYRRFCKQE